MPEENRFNLLVSPVCFDRPDRILSSSAWNEHTPFGMFLVDFLRPKMLVELGTHTGVSYCAFCQAVKKLGTGTKCYAIDTWTGDQQAGFYGPEVLAELTAYHDPLYGGFSRLLQMPFDEGVKHFSDGSIDLLHIDGRHSYKKVKHDFETWLPKLSDCGVVLFHDINERKEGFGVWKFWGELKSQYPGLEFSHGHGLGVLFVGTPSLPGLSELFSMPEDHLAAFREFFFDLGSKFTSEIQTNDLMALYKGLIQEKEQNLVVLLTKNNDLEQDKQQLYTQTTEMEGVYQQLTIQLAEKERNIQQLNEEISEKDLAISHFSAEVTEMELANQQITIQLAEKDRNIQQLNAQIESKEQALLEFTKQVIGQDQTIGQLVEQLNQKEQIAQQLTEKLTEQHATNQQLSEQVLAQENALQQLSDLVNEHRKGDSVADLEISGVGSENLPGESAKRILNPSFGSTAAGFGGNATEIGDKYLLKMNFLSQQIQRFVRAIYELNGQLSSTVVNRDQLISQNRDINILIADYQRQLNYKNSLLEEIQSGKTWKLIQLLKTPRRFFTRR